MDGTDVDVALRALLVRHPDACVTGVSDDGLFIPVPASLPADGHARPMARSGVDLVQSPDRPAVINAWRRAKDERWVQTVVRLAGTTGGTCVLHVFAAHDAHGAYVAVLVPTVGAEGHLLEVATILSSPPRFGVSWLNEHGEWVDISPETVALLGWLPSELSGALALDRIHPDDLDIVVDAWMELLSRPGGTMRSRLRHLHRDGRWVWLEMTNHNHLETAGHVMSEMLDISQEMKALEALHASEQLLRRLAGALPVGVLQLDQAGTPVYVNDRFRQLLGVQADEDCSLEGCAVESDALAAATAEALAGRDIDLELHIDPVDGSSLRRCTLAFRALTTPDGHVTGAVGCLTDITDERRMRAELEWRATVDAMTGCANRSSTMVLLEEVLTASLRPAAVVFVDLDRFKAVNDLYGHGTGDDLLVAVATRLRSAVRDVDLVGRIGGDEFLIVCPDASEPESVAIGDRLLAALDAPFSLGDRTLHASASIGIARSVAGEGPDALIARADAAMYQSKGRGGDQAVVAA